MFVIFQLGDITLNDTEVPEIINGGGQQMLSVHQLIGGLRVVDSLGKTDDNITFRGMFRGITSVDRVRYMEYLRDSGEQINFSYLDYNYTVVVKAFQYTLKPVYIYDFSMTLVVVEDLTRPVNYVVPSLISNAVLEAYQEALDIALFLNNPGIDSSLGLLGASLNAIQNLNNATLSEITSLIGGTANVITNVNNAINTITNGL